MQFSLQIVKLVTIDVVKINNLPSNIRLVNIFYGSKPASVF